MVFDCSLSDSKSPLVPWTLLSILADLNNAVVGMIATSPLISKSSSHFTNPFVIVPSTLITIGITVTFLLHSFFSSLTRSRYLYSFLLSIIIIITLKVFTPALADGFSQELERQQVFSSFQDSSQYSGQS